MTDIGSPVDGDGFFYLETEESPEIPTEAVYTESPPENSDAYSDDNESDDDANARSRDASLEQSRVRQRIQGFDPKQSEAWKRISERFGAGIKQPELVSIAKVLSENINLRLDRDARRRKNVLIKWFQENWVKIEPFLNYIILAPAT